MHNYHERLEGFDARQIWHDGCEECEARAATVPYSLGTLDDERLLRAWERMLLWVRDDYDALGPLSQAEFPLLRYLEGVCLVNERLHRLVP